MPDFTILGDAVVHDILINLAKEEILTLQKQLAESLREFSVGDERKYQVESSVSARPNGDRTLFRPFTSPTSVGVKIMVSAVDTGQNNDTSQAKDGAPQTFKKRPVQGVVVVLDNEGNPVGVIDGKEITGYRTSLSALLGYVRRSRTTNIVVFGAGKCAIWHIRLALALRGSEIKRITVVNRSKDRAVSMIDQVLEENQKLWKSDTTIEYLDQEGGKYEQALERLIQEADVIFCNITSEKPLFPASYLTKKAKADRGPYISAVGSWQSDLIEVDPSLLRYIVDSPEGYNPLSEKGGAVIVDDRKKAMEETGEGIQSRLKTEDWVEWGEIFNLENQLQTEGSSEQHQRLKSWLEDGLVVYKSIGVSITDLVTSNFLLSIARKHDLGVVVPGF